MRYLITDPCYIVPKDEWEQFCNNGLYDFYEGETTYRVSGLGNIVASSPTQYGDGAMGFGRGKEVAVDSGTVCLVELDGDVVPTDYQGTAVTANATTAHNWYKKAQKI